MLNQKKVSITVLNISFLMAHQRILPDLKELASELSPTEDGINRESPEYLLGAFEALMALISALENKGSD